MKKKTNLTKVETQELQAELERRNRLEELAKCVPLTLDGAANLIEKILSDYDDTDKYEQYISTENEDLAYKFIERVRARKTSKVKVWAE